jgi:hypothetical protein
VFENFIAIAIDYEAAKNDKLDTFWAHCKQLNGHSRFHMTTTFLNFDVATLPAARARRQELLNKQRIALKASDVKPLAGAAVCRIRLRG